MFRKIPRPVFFAWGWGLLFFAALEIWRPYYFLTDDNLCYYWPPLVAAMKRLWHGHSPFYEPNLFGGKNLLRDPVLLCLWNPLNLLLSPLALTSWKTAIVELLAASHLFVGLTSFVLMARCLRQRLHLSLSDRRIVFLSLSYTFSGFTILVGSSWQMWLVVPSILPLLVLAFFINKRSIAIWTIGLALAHGAISGHLQPIIWTGFFVSILAIAICRIERDLEPIRRWLTGAALGLLVASPLLVFAIQGYLGTDRSHSQNIEISKYRVPPQTVLLSWTLGSLSTTTDLIPRQPRILATSESSSLILASCLAGGFLWPCLFNRRRMTVLELTLLALALLSLLCVARPEWMVQLFLQLPLMKSLRWPFREILFFLFFVHLFLLVRPPAWPRPATFTVSALGACVWFASLLHIPPPSFGNLYADRQVILSGEAGQFANQVKRFQSPGSRWISVTPTEAFVYRDYVPWVLCNGFNFPALNEIPSESGYCVDGFQSTVLGQKMSFYGTFQPLAAGKLLAADASLQALNLSSLIPLRVEVVKQGRVFPLSTPDLQPYFKNTPLELGRVNR